MENLTAYRSPPPYPHSAQMLVHRSARSARECGLRVGGYHREAEKINKGGKRWHWKPHPYHRRSRCIILQERVWSNYKTMTPEPFTDVPQDCFHLFAFLLEQTTFPAESHWNEMLKSCHTRCGSPSDPISISLRSLYLFIFCHSVFSNLIGYFNAFLPFLFSVLSSLHSPPNDFFPWLLDGKTNQAFSFPWILTWFSLPFHLFYLSLFVYRVAPVQPRISSSAHLPCTESTLQLNVWSQNVSARPKWAPLRLRAEPAQPHHRDFQRPIFCLEHWAFWHLP